MRDEIQLEREIQAKNLVAPRITPSLIDSKIASSDYYVFPGTTLTICAIMLTNGFIVTGESAAASPENFDKGIGEKIAFENARQKIWALEGYLLRERLASADHHSRSIARDAATGEFTTQADAKARPGETVTEQVDVGQGKLGTLIGGDHSEEGDPPFG